MFKGPSRCQFFSDQTSDFGFYIDHTRVQLMLNISV
jgi:hypothetical protein